MKIFSIYDSAVAAYLQPVFFRSAAEAMRALTPLVRDPKHQFSVNAEDYSLFELGLWDDLNGSIVLHTAKHSICGLVELKAQAQVKESSVA